VMNWEKSPTDHLVIGVHLDDLSMSEVQMGNCLMLAVHSADSNLHILVLPS
jgi:hypothetical protein